MVKFEFGSDVGRLNCTVPVPLFELAFKVSMPATAFVRPGTNQTDAWKLSGAELAVGEGEGVGLGAGAGADVDGGVAGGAGVDDDWYEDPPHAPRVAATKNAHRHNDIRDIIKASWE